MNIAIWSYNDFGKRTSESLKKYWREEYSVTRIYDSEKAGRNDPFWNIEISDPTMIQTDYERGLFEKILVCINDKPKRDKVIEFLVASGIPVHFLGDPADFISSEEFCSEITDGEKGSRIYRCRDVMAARAYHLCWECLYVFDRNGRILRDPWIVNDWYDPEAPLMYPFPLKDPAPEKIIMSGSWCLLTKIFGNNYWHFTFQNLCDVYFLEKTGFTGTYIIPNAPYDRELMLMMGIAPERIMSIDKLSYNKVYVFEEIYGVAFDHKNTDLEASVVAEISRSIKSRLKRDPSYPRFIYIKRIGSRKLLNGDELAEKYGFATIIPEELSVREQMEHFFNADVVLCPHGANSTNCLYMRENSIFIEVFSDRWYLDINAKVCHENHVNHLKVIGKALGIAEIGIHDDYSIAEHRILPALRRMCDLIPDPPVWSKTLDKRLNFNNSCLTSAGILIYGAWTLGARAHEMISDLYGKKLLGFAVTSMEGNPEEKAGFPVRTLEEWKRTLFDLEIAPEDVVVIVALNPMFYDKVLDFINDNGFIAGFTLEELEWYYYHIKP